VQYFALSGHLVFLAVLIVRAVAAGGLRRISLSRTVTA